jgi:hypothetical protein
MVHHAWQAGAAYIETHSILLGERNIVADMITPCMCWQVRDYKLEQVSVEQCIPALCLVYVL